ncbi:MAG: hypothetical protein ABI795_08150, partial [Chthoniobacterales bacterium]
DLVLTKDVLYQLSYMGRCLSFLIRRELPKSEASDDPVSLSRRTQSPKVANDHGTLSRSPEKASAS